MDQNIGRTRKFSEVESFNELCYDEGSTAQDSAVDRNDNDKNQKVIKDVMQEYDKAVQQKLFADNRIEEMTHKLQKFEHQVIALELQYTREPLPVDVYDHKSELGRGAFGATHKMRNSIDKGLYAVKEISVRHAEKGGLSLDALMQEAKILQKINHTNIVRYYTCFFSREETLFNVVMELVEGGTIADKIKDEAVRVMDIAKWWNQLASALVYMHFDMKLLHRDIKPENIMLTASDVIKIIDLGMASIFRSSASKMSKVGTSTYYSFEKASDITYDGRDDVWAAGCVMAELMTKSRLVERGGAIYMLYNKQVNDRRLKLIADCVSVDAVYGEIIGRMLEPLQDNRCNSKELVDLLDKLSFQGSSSNMPIAVQSTNTSSSRVAVISDSRIAPKSQWFPVTTIAGCHGWTFFQSFLNPQGTRIVTQAQGNDKSDVKVWNVAAGNEITNNAIVPLAYAYKVAGFISENKLLIISNTFIGLMNINTNEVEELLSDPFNIEYKGLSAIYATLDGTIAYGRYFTEGSVKVWDINHKTLLTTIKDNASVFYADMDTNGRYVVTGNDRALVKLWNGKTGELIREYVGHKGNVFCVKISSNAQRIASSSADKTIIIWDCNSSDLLFHLLGHSGSIRNLCWNSVDTVIVSASDDRTVNVWDAINGTLIQSLEGHEDSVRMVKFSSDNTEIVTTSDDKSIKIWT